MCALLVLSLVPDVVAMLTAVDRAEAGSSYLAQPIGGFDLLVLNLESTRRFCR